MERVKPLLKVAAVLSAVCLVGAFVAYRAGAFDSPPPPAPPPAEPSPTPDPPPAQPPTPESPASPVFIVGSKSGFVYDEKLLKDLTGSTQSVWPVPANPPGQPAGMQATTPANPVFMGGSKYLAPLFNPTTGLGAAEKSSQPAPPAPIPPKKAQ